MLLGQELNIAKYFMQILIRFGTWENTKCQKGIRYMSVLVYMYKKKNLMSFYENATSSPISDENVL